MKIWSLRFFVQKCLRDLELAVGDELEVEDDEEDPMLVMVSEMTDTTVTLDGNPPLAGEVLTFELELVAIG